MPVCNFKKRWFAVWEQRLPDGSLSEGPIWLNTYLCKSKNDERAIFEVSEKDKERIATIDSAKNEDCEVWLSHKLGNFVRLYAYDKIHHLFHAAKKLKKTKKFQSAKDLLFEINNMAKKEKIPHLIFCANTNTDFSVNFFDEIITDYEDKLYSHK